MTNKPYQPEMTNAGLGFSKPAITIDEPREIELVGARALTIYVDKQEIVTLMTMATHPEMLTPGYLKNQGFFEDITDIKTVQVYWGNRSGCRCKRTQAQ